MTNFSKDEVLKLVLEAYSAGVSRGLLYANQQEEDKSLFDSFLCHLHDIKTSTANQPIIFEPKSDKWIKGTKKEADKIYDIIQNIK